MHIHDIWGKELTHEIMRTFSGRERKWFETSDKIMALRVTLLALVLLSEAWVLFPPDKMEISYLIGWLIMHWVVCFFVYCFGVVLLDALYCAAKDAWASFMGGIKTVARFIGLQKSNDHAKS